MNNYSSSLSLQFVLYIFATRYICSFEQIKQTQHDYKYNQDRTGQLSTHNIFYQTVVAVTQFIQK